jgi:ribose-phosphate pyrophosphokinase
LFNNFIRMLSKTKGMKIIDGGSHPALANQISDYLNHPLTPALTGNFSCGEAEIKIDGDVRGASVFVIQSTNAPADNILKLILTVDALRRASAGHITVVIPYFGYARQDRKDTSRVPISAKVVADMLQNCGVDRVLTMDLHSAQIQGFFDIPLDHLYGFPILAKYAEEHILTEDTFCMGPDVGSMRITTEYAEYLGVDFGLVHKKRVGKTLEIVGIVGDVGGKDVLLVDDMVDTCETMAKVCEKIIEFGAKSISIMYTHGVLSGAARENFNKIRVGEDKLKHIVGLNTFPTTEAFFENADELPSTVLSVAPLFGEAIKCIYNQESMSKLFIYKREGTYEKPIH